MEIERKFLTTTIPLNLDAFIHSKIKQLYISLKPTIRIRQTDDSYTLTIKGSGDISREEYELEISEEEFLNLSNKSETPPLLKTRYYIPLFDDLVAELDIYDGNLNGLMTTEVEFKTITAAADFIPPSWMGSDISYDNRYKNTSLAQNGIPK